MEIKGLYFKRAKCNNCGLEQNIALSDVPEWKTFDDIMCRGCKSKNKTEIPLLTNFQSLRAN